MQFSGIVPSFWQTPSPHVEIVVHSSGMIGWPHPSAVHKPQSAVHTPTSLVSQ
jgi:hypothetical protein